MDGQKFNDAKNQLKNLKNLFSRFVNISNRINMLRDANDYKVDPVGNAVQILKVASRGTNGCGYVTSSVSNDPKVSNNGIAMHEFEVGLNGAHSIYDQSRSFNNGKAMHEFDVGICDSDNSNAYFNKVSPVVSQERHNLSNDPNLSNNGIAMHEFQVGLNAEADSVYSNIGNVVDWKLLDQSRSFIYGNAVHEFDVKFNSDSGYSNIHDQSRSFNNGNAMHEVDVGSGCSSGDDYSNVMENVMRAHSNGRVMGIDLPNDSIFNEDHLEAILSKGPSDTANYIYYLFGDNVAHDSLNAVESNVYAGDHVTVGLGSTFRTSDFNSGTTSEQTLVVVQTTLISPELYNAAPFIMDRNRHHGCDNTNMFVPTSGTTPKRRCCVYCLKRYLKLVRHLETVHKNEVDVKKIRDLPIGSKERRAIIDMVRKKGQFYWNTNAEINGGELSTSRRPNEKFQRTAIEFLACANCFGNYSSRTLRIHWNRCTTNSLRGERIVKELGRAVEGRVHRSASDALLNLVLAGMRDDKCSRIIRFDWLIIEFGNDLSLNLDPVTQNTCIRNQLRYAGKLLLALKSVSSEITDLASLFRVKHCNTVVQAVRMVSRFDVQTKRIGSTGAALALVTLINNVGNLLVIERMKEDDTVEEENVERFLKVFKKDARLKITKLVGVEKAKAKRLRDDDIPTTADIKIFTDYLDVERDKCFVELSKGYSYKLWLLLTELTLVSTLVFNRRRTGEMQRILLVHFLRRKIILEECNKSMEVIPETTKQTVKSRMRVRGKLDRTVPVLLKHSYDDCIQLIVKHRKDAGIQKKNEHLFAVPTQSGMIKMVNACAAMTKFSKKCMAINPKSLRGTKLRKHLASMCATMNLSDNDVTNVADFMGHSDAVHRNIYRQNPLQQQVVQMTALLEAARGCSGSASRRVVTKKPVGNRKKIRPKIGAKVVIRKTIGITAKPKVGKRNLSVKKIINHNIKK